MFTHFLVSFHFPQVSSSYRDMLAEGGVWTAYTRATENYSLKDGQYQRLSPPLRTDAATC